MEISKADWKLFRERVPEWQENYMEQLVKEYIDLLSSPGNASDHFWELEKRIKRDKKHPGVILEINKSDAIWDIAVFVKCQTAHCGRRKPHFDFCGNTSPIVPYRHLPQTLRGLTADCRSLV